MNLGQMVMIILALILFATVILTLNKNIVTESEDFARTAYITQADYYVDYILQKYENDVLRGAKTIKEVFLEHPMPTMGVYHHETEINGVKYSVLLRTWYFNTATYTTNPSETNSVLVAGEVLVVKGDNEWKVGTVGSWSRINLFESGTGRLIDSQYNKVITYHD
ncbi:MAG: hypothetical protein FWG20_04835 [Candidatus Cloacimonetes bacterium]|nr:hypothetical protein [Candidatus Cloacimonadota bacterium]